nr:isochorismatase family cysteine hydrolase [uncultured Acetatifactor sp.]
MDRRYLIVVDMQKDFIDGALGTDQALEILPKVVEKIKSFPGTVIYTQDTHGSDYLSTQEGKILPVEHCIKGTEGWKLADPVRELCERKKAEIYEKDTFGCRKLAMEMLARHMVNPIDSIEIVGLCTDICVVSNALLLKAFLPQVKICADASCMAGVTPKKHEAALETMKSCQIHII